MTDQTLQPYQVATMIGVDVGTIRRWCAWHSSLLSAGASPPPGGRRHLTPHDVEVLRAVKGLRDEGLQTTAINEQLAGKAFAIVASPDSPATAQEALQAPSAHFDDGNSTELLRSLSAAFLRSQGQRERLHGFVLGLSVGLVVAAVFFLIIVLLVRPG